MRTAILQVKFIIVWLLFSLLCCVYLDNVFPFFYNTYQSCTISVRFDYKIVRWLILNDTMIEPFFAFPWCWQTTKEEKKVAKGKEENQFSRIFSMKKGNNKNNRKKTNVLFIFLVFVCFFNSKDCCLKIFSLQAAKTITRIA